MLKFSHFVSGLVESKLSCGACMIVLVVVAVEKEAALSLLNPRDGQLGSLTGLRYVPVVLMLNIFDRGHFSACSKA
jgi:hypothetical protein